MTAANPARSVLAAEHEIRRQRQALARAELIQRVTARECAAARTPIERRRLEAQLARLREQTRQALAALSTAQGDLEAILLHKSGPRQPTPPHPSTPG